jgi:hypothetical protein
VDGLFLQSTELRLFPYQRFQLPMDVGMTYLLEPTKLYLTSNVLLFAAWSFYPGLDAKPLNAGCELQKPVPLLADLSEHVLTSYGLPWRLSQFSGVNHSCDMCAMTGLQILWAVSLNVVLIKRLLIYTLLGFVGNKLAIQIPT